MSEKQRPNANEPNGIHQTLFAGLKNNIFGEIFNRTWDSLTPGNITLEALESASPNLQILYDSIEKCELFSFPLHGFFEENYLSLKQTKKFENEKLKIDWEVHLNSQSPHLAGLAYKINLLYFKRRILQSRSIFPSVIEISDLREVASAIGEEKLGQQIIFEALESNFYCSLDIKITKETKDSSPDIKHFSFNPFTGWASRTLKAATDEKSEMVGNLRLVPFNKIFQIRIGIDNSYLKILASTPPVEFDWNYIKELLPDEIRCYELLSYKRFENQASPAKTVEWKYSDLCRMMPFKPAPNLKIIQGQLEGLLVNHYRSGWLKDVKIEPIENVKKQLDAHLYFRF